MLTYFNCVGYPEHAAQSALERKLLQEEAVYNLEEFRRKLIFPTITRILKYIPYVKFTDKNEQEEWIQAELEVDFYIFKSIYTVTVCRDQVLDADEENWQVKSIKSRPLSPPSGREEFRRISPAY